MGDLLPVLKGGDSKDWGGESTLRGGEIISLYVLLLLGEHFPGLGGSIDMLCGTSTHTTVGTADLTRRLLVTAGLWPVTSVDATSCLSSDVVTGDSGGSLEDSSAK